MRFRSPTTQVGAAAEPKRRRGRERLRTAALANLAIEQSGGRDMVAAIARVRMQFDSKDDEIDDNVGRMLVGLVEHMLEVLREAGPIINFRAAECLGEADVRAKTPGRFEVERTAGAPMGDKRDTIEERMFDCSRFGRVDPNTATPGPKAAAIRIEDYGRLHSAKFTGSIRPKHRSVNLPGLIDDFGAQWADPTSWSWVISSRTRPSSIRIPSTSSGAATIRGRARRPTAPSRANTSCSG